MSRLEYYRQKLNEVESELEELEEVLVQTSGKDVAVLYKGLKEKRAQLLTEYNEAKNGQN